MYILRPDQFGTPQPRDFRVHSYGGPTQANLVLETLQLGSRRLQDAAAIAEEQGHALAGMGEELLGTAAGCVPHWRVPIFCARLGVSTAQMLTGSRAMEETSEAVERAHESYRDTESLVVHWLGAARHLGQYPAVYPHVLHPEGDRAVADAWARTAAVNLGHSGVLLFTALARRRPALRASSEAGGLVAQAALEKVRRSSRASSQSLDPGARRLAPRRSAQVADYLEAHAEVARHGDFSISSTARSGTRVHRVHIPGLELPEGLAEMDLQDLAEGELDLSAGRGLNSLADAVTNDSSHLQGVIEEALQRSGAQPGDELVISGYSQGGLHALNIAAGGVLARKYRITDVVTVGAPGREGPISPGVRTTSFQDVNDPVPRLMGEQSQLSASRVEIRYEHQAPQGEPGGIFGQSHGYDHNTEAIRRLEADPAAHLDAGAQEHLQELTQQVRGEHRATVYSTQWDAQGTREVEEAVAELAAKLQPGEGELGLGVEGAQDEPVQQR
ncbi:hypothetical protein [Nesterenkonia lutea]|uniref:Fungal lipase-like domain-containing protein n=1 Tax=Nesterenkonia lutea TaxID=272919 RepID=A0ABR9JG27_9MICC|nr:hypothetical protein [Nesterenkonia lutea]MBE1524786.1 hypothetical protein [Nesterenkonia lutea]